MAFVGEFMEDVKDSRLGSDPGISVNSKVAGNLVSGLKANPKDIGSQTVRIILDDSNGALTVLFVNLGGIGGADPVTLEEDHNFSDFPLGVPSIFDHLNPLFSYPFDFLKAVRIGVNNVKGSFLKMLYQPAGHYGADSLDQA